MRRVLAVAIALMGCSSDEVTADVPDLDADADADAADEGGQDVPHDRIVPELDVIDVDSDADVPRPPSFAVRAPATAVEGVPVPVVVYALDELGEIDASLNGLLTLETSGGLEFATAEVLLRRGVGSITTDWTGGGGIGFGGSVPAQIVASTSDPLVVEGQLAGDQTWAADRVVRVASDLVIDGDLRIEPGVWVLVAEGVNIDISGTTTIRGERSRPIVFAPSEAAWGGITFGSDADVSEALFIGGGSDASREFGHSDSQPVLFGEGVDVVIADSVIQDAVGKAMGARAGSWSITRTLVTRTDTGGEFEFASVTVDQSHYFDFPEIDPAPRDDDNDAIYLLGDPDDDTPPPITIRGSTFLSGADDGIDHNGSSVTIEGSWIEGFDNECVAASSGGSVSLRDTALVGCGQGLEAGYGSPTVTAEHLLIMQNDVGVRFGDSYEREYTGTLEIRASVLIENTERAVWNWLFGAEAPAEDRVSVSNSVLDVDEAEGGEGNVVGEPVFTDLLLLAPGSPGTGIATDGSDPGLVTGRPR